MPDLQPEDESEIEILDSYQDMSSYDLAKYAHIWNEEYPTVIKRVSKRTFLEKEKTEKPVKIIIAKNKSSGELVRVLVLELEVPSEAGAWFTMVVSRAHQRKGIGTKLLEKAKQLVPALHGWIIPSNCYKKPDGTGYLSPLGFYKRLGFHEEESRFIEKKIAKIDKNNVESKRRKRKNGMTCQERKRHVTPKFHC